MTQNIFRLGIFAFVGILLNVSAHATPKNWATTDGNWNVDANWSPVGVPATTDDANVGFADGVARTVTLDSTGPAATAMTFTLDQTGAGTNASTLAIIGNTLNDFIAVVGDHGIGVVNQSGGVHNVTTNLSLGNQVGGVGTYSLNAGAVLNVGSVEYVGGTGPGTFTQTGGSHTVNTLVVGYYPSSLGSYTLSGSSSSLQVTNESIGDGATGNGTQSGGTFTQSAGSHQVSQLFMAQEIGSTASYELSGGILNSQYGENIGQRGSATFTQTGGANSSADLELGSVAGGSGTYTISSGGLNAGSIEVGGNGFGVGGTGALTISGSAVAKADNGITIYNTLGSAVLLQGGTLTTSSINVHGVPSLFKWNSGTLNLTTDVTWDPSNGANPTSSLFGTSLTLGSGRTLNISGNETIGGAGPFTFSLNGGTHAVSGDITLKAGGTFSETSNPLLTYTNFKQVGGTLNTFTNNSNYVYQGGVINGQFTNNGTATFAATVSISGNVQNNGTITVNAGQQFAGGVVTNLGSFVLAGGAIVQNTFTNSAGGTFTAHGSMGQLVNHGTFILDGVLAINNSASTNDGTIQGAGTINSTTSSPFTNNAGGIVNATTAGATLAFATPITNLAGAVLNVGPSSTLVNGSTGNGWTNSGVVNLQGTGAKLSGNAITNTGTIQGIGLVSSSFGNGNAGVIRAIGGELNFTAQSFSNAPSGQIQAAAGGSVVILQGMSSNSGMISLTGGTFDNAIHSLTNNGTINGFGTIRTSGLTNSTGKLVSVGEGNLDVFGNFTNNGVVNIQTGRSAYFYGTVNGAGSFTGGGTAVFLNSLSPGNSPAMVTIAGGATLVGSTSLAMELGGTTAGTEYDQLKVGGALSIGGILSVSLINGFMPAVGSSFDLLDWGTLGGTFSSLSLPSLSVGQWDTSQLYTTGILSVAPGSALAGDYNNNGVVDAADYIAWRHGLGTTYTQTDYDVWRTHFGTTAGSGSQLADGQTAAVPEPATVLLALLGPSCWTLIAGRRRP